MSGLLLKNGDFVACVYRGLTDDFASARMLAIAAKIIKAARKKFSKFTLKIFDREISAWDYFCYSQHAGGAAGADKFISDYIRVSLIKRIEDIPPPELNLLAIAVIRLEDIDEATELSAARVFERAHREVIRLAAAHGESVAMAALSSGEPAQPLLAVDP